MLKIWPVCTGAPFVSPSSFFGHFLKFLLLCLGFYSKHNEILQPQNKFWCPVFQEDVASSEQAKCSLLKLPSASIAECKKGVRGKKSVSWDSWQLLELHSINFTLRLLCGKLPSAWKGGFLINRRSKHCCAQPFAALLHLRGFPFSSEVSKKSSLLLLSVNGSLWRGGKTQDRQ